MTEAIVLAALDYKESSKILYLYTETGQVSVIAHGVKKMNNLSRHLSQPVSIIQVDLSSKRLPSLKDASLVNDFASLKTDIMAFTYASHICDLVRHTVDEHNDHKKMYSFLKRLLNEIAQGKDAELYSAIFELKLLYFLGYGFHLKHCVICGKEENLVFSIHDGGLVCSSHKEPHLLYYDETFYPKMFTLYYHNIEIPYDQEFTKNERIMLRHLIDELYEEFISYRSKSREILKQLQNTKELASFFEIYDII